LSFVYHSECVGSAWKKIQPGPSAGRHIVIHGRRE